MSIQPEGLGGKREQNSRKSLMLHVLHLCNDFVTPNIQYNQRLTKCNACNTFFKPPYIRNLVI